MICPTLFLLTKEINISFNTFKGSKQSYRAMQFNNISFQFTTPLSIFAFEDTGAKSLSNLLKVRELVSGWVRGCSASLKNTNCPLWARNSLPWGPYAVKSNTKRLEIIVTEWPNTQYPTLPGSITTQGCVLSSWGEFESYLKPSSSESLLVQILSLFAPDGQTCWIHQVTL